MRDIFNIINHLSLLRIYNLLQLIISYFLTRLIKKPIHWGKPFSLSIEPTTACNLGCPECPSGLKKFKRPTGKIDLELNEKILQQVSKSVFYINYYFQGEPFLHPQFLQLIKQAKKHKIYTSTSTNAHFIDQNKAEEIIASGLDRLIISIDGLTQESYQNYRINGNLETVLKATQLLIETKKKRQSKTPYLIFQFLAVKQNEHEISSVFDLGNKLGIDEVRIKTAQLYDYKNGHELMPENSDYSRYQRQSDGTYVLKYKVGNHCWRMWSGSVITWDGKVVPCCFDKDASHILGNILIDSFNSIWKNDRYQKFRFEVIKNRSQIEICQNCSEGSKVWVS